MKRAQTYCTIFNEQDCNVANSGQGERGLQAAGFGDSQRSSGVQPFSRAFSGTSALPTPESPGACTMDEGIKRSR